MIGVVQKSQPWACVLVGHAGEPCQPNSPRRSYGWLLISPPRQLGSAALGPGHHCLGWLLLSPQLPPAPAQWWTPIRTPLAPPFPCLPALGLVCGVIWLTLSWIGSIEFQRGAFCTVLSCAEHSALIRMLVMRHILPALILHVRALCRLYLT